MGMFICLFIFGFEEREEKKINNDLIMLRFENRIWFI